MTGLDEHRPDYRLSCSWVVSNVPQCLKILTSHCMLFQNYPAKSCSKPSWLKSGDIHKTPGQDKCFITQHTDKKAQLMGLLQKSWKNHHFSLKNYVQYIAGYLLNTHAYWQHRDDIQTMSKCAE